MSVGYKSQNNYDDYNEKQRRNLPWRERYDWGNVVVLVVIAIGVVTWFVCGR